MKNRFIITKVCDLEEGTRTDGRTWYNRELVLTTADGSLYPDSIVATLWGDDAQGLKGGTLTEGALVEAEISFRAYESTARPGRWFQSTGIFSIVRLS